MVRIGLVSKRRHVFPLASILDMATTHDTAAFDRAVDPVIGFFTREQAEALVGYRGDDSLRNRIDELAERNTEGKLTDEELAEYEGYVRANKFVATLQAQARKLLTDD